MIELLLVTTALLIVVYVVKPGRTPPLQNPLVIDRTGQYHITLAPQLNLAQPYIEDIAKQLGNTANLPPDSSTFYFEVRDADVKAHGSHFYLLAITQCNGKLYFQAISSHAGFPQDRLNELQEFAKAVMINIPVSTTHDEVLNQRIIAAALDAAKARGIQCTQL